MMELKETVEMMNSADYKERFKAEYYQLNIRLEKLKMFVKKYNKGELDFEPDCSLELLSKQLQHMEIYRDMLLERAGIEKITIK